MEDQRLWRRLKVKVASPLRKRGMSGCWGVGEEVGDPCGMVGEIERGERSCMVGRPCWVAVDVMYLGRSDVVRVKKLKPNKQDGSAE
jgi:hypothetical protein